MEPEISLQRSQEPATCPYPEPDRSSPCPHPNSRRSILVLFSHLYLCVPSGVLPSGFSTKTLCVHLDFSIRATCFSRLSLLDLINRIINIWWGVQSITLLLMYSSLFLCYLFFLKSKYPPQHPILEIPQLTLKNILVRWLRSDFNISLVSQRSTNLIHCFFR